MPTPGEHKTVQARILAYAQEIGWTYVPRGEAEKRRGFDPEGATPAERARTASPYFDDLLDAQVLRFQSEIQEAEGALVGDLQRLHADIAGNRDFLAYLRNTQDLLRQDKRELNLVLIDYDDCRPREECNVFEVTEEFYCHNGKHGTREDVVFLINGIPVLVIECKNATQGRGDRAGRRSDPPLPRRDAGAVRAADGLHRHRGDRLFLRRHLEPDPPQHLQLEARAEGQPGGEGQELLRPPHVLRLLKDYILFAEKDEELQKFILRQHQTTAVEKVVAARRCDPKATRAGWSGTRRGAARPSR